MIKYDIPSQFSPESLIPLSQLQRGAGKIIEQLQVTRQPLLILDRGRPVACLTPLTQSERSSGEHAARKKRLLDALQQMLPLIIERYRPEKIILFGSVAKGGISPASDLDLLIVKKTKKRFIDRQRELLQITQPQIAVDFFIYTPEEFASGIKEKKFFFAEEILKKGKILYEKAD